VDADVLVVGAGPTGLMLANQLGRRGLRAPIIDRHAGSTIAAAPWRNQPPACPATRRARATDFRGCI